MKKLIVCIVFTGILSWMMTTEVQSQDTDTLTISADTTLIISPDTVVIDTSALETSVRDTTVRGEVTDKLSDIENLISFGNILLIIFLLALTYILNRLIVSILDNISERSTKYRLGIKRLVPVSRIVIWAFAFYIIIVGIIEPPWTTVVTVLASIGIAVGFAAQDILKNIFGGFIIILDRPFQVGDKIEVGEYYGEVLSIGLRSTRIVTPDDSIVSIPNGELMNRAVSNANSSALDCQVVAEIYLPAETDIDIAKRIAYKAAVSSRYVYLQKPIAVIALNEVQETNFMIKLRVKAYVLDIRYEFPFKSDMTELILGELNRKGFLADGH